MRTTLPVSVVIPARNAAEYITVAVTSLRDGTVEPAEIIVVDDGSSDRTADLARSAGARVLSGPHRGVSAARNSGMAAARHEWIALLDADDVARPGRLAQQWNAHLARPSAGLIVGDASLNRLGAAPIPSSLAIDRRYRAMRRSAVAPGVVLLERASTVANLARWNCFRPSTVLIERNLALAEPFDETLPSSDDVAIGEDWEWFLRLVVRSEVLVCERPLTDYRLRPGSASADRCRMTRGDLELGSLVMRRPEIYTPALSSAFARWRDAHYRAAARACAHAGRPDHARPLLAAALQERRSALTVALLFAVLASDSRSGRALAAAARTAWNRRPRIRSRLPES